jgi:hypothetical protein
MLVVQSNTNVHKKEANIYNDTFNYVPYLFYKNVNSTIKIFWKSISKLLYIVHKEKITQIICEKKESKELKTKKLHCFLYSYVQQYVWYKESYYF